MVEEIKRKLYLFKDIDNESVEPIITEIIKTNDYDSDQQKNVVNYKRNPIQIYISTYGGVVYDGLGLVDVIRMSKTPIHTIVVGYAMSMGLLIAACGHKRYAYDSSTFMYHESSGGSYGKLKHINQSVKEFERLQKIYDDRLISLCDISREKLESVKKHREEWYLSASEAKEYKLFDDYI